MHEQPRKLFTQTLFIGVGGFWGGFFSLESKFLYRYRPEGIFRIFFGLILDPPPVHMLLQRKKANSFVPAIFFPMAWPF